MSTGQVGYVRWLWQLCALTIVPGLHNYDYVETMLQMNHLIANVKFLIQIIVRKYRPDECSHASQHRRIHTTADASQTTDRLQEII